MLSAWTGAEIAPSAAAAAPAQRIFLNIRIAPYSGGCAFALRAKSYVFLSSAAPLSTHFNILAKIAGALGFTPPNR
jgi:hypothetical protein